jgi:hypothetical protein
MPNDHEMTQFVSNCTDPLSFLSDTRIYRNMSLKATWSGLMGKFEGLAGMDSIQI